MTKSSGPGLTAKLAIIGLPEGSVITEVTPWRPSGWTQTAYVRAQLPLAGPVQEYFMKTCSADFGALMMEGEFHFLKAIHAHIPASCPEPLGWGECQTKPGTFFLLMEFLHLEPEHPDAEALSKLTADLHRLSAGETEQFGFPVPNCHGKIIQPNDWDADWSNYFTNLITAFYNADIAANGPEDGEYGRLFELLKRHVIPRLLKPLQAEGRVLQPCLVHGDLWRENTCLTQETNRPMVYDASAFYGHNEYEVGTWRTVFVAFDESYREQYRRHYPASEPKEEWEDRNRLYSIPFNITHSAGWVGAAETTRPR